jgi:hypothetical protein
MKHSLSGFTFRVATLTAVAIGAWAAAPAIPRLPDGRPDLNGTWDNGGGIDFLKPKQLPGGSVCVSGCDAAAGPRVRVEPDFPKYRPEFVARQKELAATQVKTDPVLRCQPPGVPRIGPPDKIVQTAREVVFLYEDVSGPFFRVIPLDPKAKRADDSETYLGDALGRWDGDSLVVESRNFNTETWLTDNGAFHSAKLSVTERLTPVGDRIEYRARVEDPEVLAEPWDLRPRGLVRADAELAEPAPCVEQSLGHMMDDTYHTNPR